MARKYSIEKQLPKTRAPYVQHHIVVSKPVSFASSLEGL
jgi:hypothetical protein